MKPNTLTARIVEAAMRQPKQALGMVLIVLAIGMLLYDFFSPPVGEISNFTLILFAKITAIAGGLLNLNITIGAGKD